MFCPNCGTQCDSNFCPNCGRRLATSEPSAPEIPAPPPGKYECAVGYILLEESSLTLYKKVLFQAVQRKMQYTDITAIAYKEAKGLGMGCLCLRERRDALKPIDTGNAAADDSSIPFGVRENELFYRIYCALKPFADANAMPLSCDSAAPGTHAASRTEVDLEPYFQTYYPGRMQAVKALHRDTGYDLRQCKALIDTYFDTNAHRAPVRSKDPIGDRKKQLQAEGIVYCPKCLSTSITARKKGFSVTKGLLGSTINPAVGLLAGSSGANKIDCVCLNCGHTFKPGK